MVASTSYNHLTNKRNHGTLRVRQSRVGSLPGQEGTRESLRAVALATTNPPVTRQSNQSCKILQALTANSNNVGNSFRLQSETYANYQSSQSCPFSRAPKRTKVRRYGRQDCVKLVEYPHQWWLFGKLWLKAIAYNGKACFNGGGTGSGRVELLAESGESEEANEVQNGPSGLGLDRRNCLLVYQRVHCRRTRLLLRHARTNRV